VTYVYDDVTYVYDDVTYVAEYIYVEYRLLERGELVKRLRALVRIQ